MLNNRLYNLGNTYQNYTEFPRVLCVCSAGLLRSPSLAYYLANKGFNTRAAGTEKDYALIPLEEGLIEWADMIVFVNPANYQRAANKIPEHKKVVVLDIPDEFEYRDPQLMAIIDHQWKEYISKEEQIVK